MPKSLRKEAGKTFKQKQPHKGRKHSGKGAIGWVSLAMINLAIIYSVRGLPLMAEEGFRAISFMAVSALFFLIPISLVTAELSSTWPPKGDGGVYIWVNEALGKRWAFLAIWLQWSENVIWFPTVLSFIAATLAYAFSPDLAENKVYTLVVVLVVYWGGTFANLRGMKTSAHFAAHDPWQCAREHPVSSSPGRHWAGICIFVDADREQCLLDSHRPYGPALSDHVPAHVSDRPCPEI